MITRKQYLNDECTHTEYFRQFVTKSRINSVRLSIGLDTILLSKDEHLNDISLNRWDRIHFHDEAQIRKEFRDNGDTFPPAWKVCLAKQCARIIQEYHRELDSLPIEEKIKLVCPY